MTVQVWLADGDRDVEVGQLYSTRRRRTETATFVYDDSYLARAGAYPLEPALPMVAGTLHSGMLAIFGAFGDSAPDRWGRNLVRRAERLRARESGTAERDLSELDYLLGVRDDLRQGALRFRIDPGGEFVAPGDDGIPALIDLPELLDISRRVESDTVAGDEIRRLVRAGSSLGGARPKAHVRTADGKTAIAKFPSEAADTWNVMAWERVVNVLAARAGIETAVTELVMVGGRHVLIVDRFDRREGRRIDYRSAMTMLEARDGDQRSYLDLAEVIEETSPATTRDLRELWRRIVFTVMVSNTDDHLRNHGFLRDGPGWGLSPAFDINPNPAPGTKYLSLAIDGSDPTASLRLVLEVAPLFRMGLDEARSVLAAMAGVVAGWREEARRVGLTGSEINRMVTAFDHPGIDVD